MINRFKNAFYGSSSSTDDSSGRVDNIDYKEAIISKKISGVLTRSSSFREDILSEVSKNRANAGGNSSRGSSNSSNNTLFGSLQRGRSQIIRKTTIAEDDETNVSQYSASNNVTKDSSSTPTSNQHHQRDRRSRGFAGGGADSSSKVAKFRYTRPEFLQLRTDDEIIVSADHQIRPIILPRDVSRLPWKSGYAECINAGKSLRNEDQAASYQDVAVRQSCLLNHSLSDSIRDQIPWTYFGLFDGHAGAAVAVAASAQLHNIVSEKLRDVADLLIALEFDLDDNEDDFDDEFNDCHSSQLNMQEDDDPEQKSTAAPCKPSGVSDEVLTSRALKEDNNNESGANNDQKFCNNFKEPSDIDAKNRPTNPQETNPDDKEQHAHDVLEHDGTIIDPIKSGATTVNQEEQTNNQNATAAAATTVAIASSSSDTTTNSGSQSLKSNKLTQLNDRSQEVEQTPRRTLNSSLSELDRENSLLPNMIDICRNNITVDSLITGALESAFWEMDAMIGTDKHGYKMPGGCTAIISVFILGKLYVCNAGDSRAIVYKKDQVIPMSFDFTPTSERERILRLGLQRPEFLGNEFTHLEFLKRPTRKDLGKQMLYKDAYMTGWSMKTITYDDLRFPLVWGDGKRSRVLATIGVTRGFGDHELRAQYGAVMIKPFLTPEPEVKILQLESDDTITAEDVLIMGTDGLWDVTGNDEAADIIRHSFDLFPDNEESRSKYRYITAAQDLVIHSRGHTSNWNNVWRTGDDRLASLDDISVFVIPLKPYRDEYLEWKKLRIELAQQRRSSSCQPAPPPPPPPCAPPQPSVAN